MTKAAHKCLSIEELKRNRRASKLKYKAAHPDRVKEQNKNQNVRKRALLKFESSEKRDARKARTAVLTRERYAASQELRDRVRAAGLLKKYGITVAQRDALFESQGRACGACRSPDPKNKNGWHIDHDHVTGNVRGLLCHHCNVALGNLGDNLEGVTLGAAHLARYLTVPDPSALPAHAGLLFSV